MKTKIALAALCGAIAAGCASPGKWNEAVFPHQMEYGMPAPPAPVAATPTK